MPPVIEKVPSAFRDDDDVEVSFEFDEGEETTHAEPAAGKSADAESDSTRATKAADAEGEGEPDELTRTRTDLANERTRREAAERQAADADTNARARIAAAEAAALGVQKQGSKGMLDAIDAKIRAALEGKKLARKEANSDVEIEMDERIATLRGQKAKIENDVLPSIDRAEATLRQNQQRQPASSPAAGQTAGSQTPRNDMARQWAGMNPALMGDPERSQAVAFMSREIHNGGLSPEDPAHFAELTKRLAVAFPKSGVRGIANPKPAPKGPPVQGNRTQASGKPNPNKITLTSKDAASMRKFKLNPADPKARKAYAQALRDIAQSEGNHVDA